MCENTDYKAHTECKLEIHQIPRYTTYKIVPIQSIHKWNCTMLQCAVFKRNTVNKAFKYEKMTCKQHTITEDF